MGVIVEMLEGQHPAVPRLEMRGTIDRRKHVARRQFNVREIKFVDLLEQRAIGLLGSPDHRFQVGPIRVAGDLGGRFSPEFADGHRPLVPHKTEPAVNLDKLDLLGSTVPARPTKAHRGRHRTRRLVARALGSSGSPPIGVVFEVRADGRGQGFEGLQLLRQGLGKRRRTDHGGLV